MSRSGYSDDLDEWDLIRWRGQVASAIRGRRGQKLLRDLLAALDSLPEKRLIKNDLVTEQGDVCALGALGKVRGLDLREVDESDPQAVAEVFDIAHQLAAEIAYENDEAWYAETPEHRWSRMRTWVESKLLPA